MHTTISLSRPLPPLLPVRSRHPLDVDPLDFRRPAPRPPTILSQVGDPPAHLAALHRPAVLNEILDRTRAHLREPVRIVEGDNSTYFMLRGVLSFHPLAEGQVVVVHHQRRTGRTTKRTEVDAGTFDLERMLPLQDTIDALRRDLYDAVFRADHAHPATIKDYVEWAHGALLGVLARDEHWREPGDEVLDALGLEPMHVAIARNIPPVPGLPAASLAAYNHVVRHADAYEQLLCDNAELIPLYGLLRDEPDFPTVLEPIAALRRFLLKRGLSPALWRRIARPGRTEPFPVIVTYPEQTRTDSVLSFLWRIDRLGPQYEPPSWLVEGTIRWAVPGDDCELDVRTRACNLAASRMAVLHAHAEPATRLAMQEMVDLVLRWATEAADLESHAFARMTWTTIARRARLHRERAEAADIVFAVPFERMEIDGYEVIALSSALALKDEGVAMRHCVANYAKSCLEGRRVVCSVRKMGDPRGRWTLSLDHSAHWSLDAIAGWANSHETPEVRSIALHLIGRLNRSGSTG